MGEITAAAVKSLRDKTGLPMMKCKKALEAADGDEQTAIEQLRVEGAKTQAIRSDRETAFGRMGIYASIDPPAGAMVEVKCESAQVAAHDDFVNFTGACAEQLATGPGANTAEELLAQPAPGGNGKTLGEVKDDLFNRMGEVMNLGRMVRFDESCGAYSHNSGTVSGVLVAIEGGNAEAARDVAMHVTAQAPAVVNKEELDPAAVAKEREILTDAAKAEGKPDNIIEKMVEGRLRNYYAEHVLNEQPFVKDDSMTVAKFANSHGMKVKRFAHWVMGKE